MQRFARFIRYAMLIASLFLLLACQLVRYLDPSPDFLSETIEEEQNQKQPVRFVRASATPILTLEGAAAVTDVTPDRAYENGEPLVARVNDEPIFLDTYEHQVAEYKALLQSQGIDLTEAEGQARLLQLRERILEDLLDQMIIQQQAQLLGIAVTEDEVEATTQQAFAQAEAEIEFEDWLADNDLTSESFFDKLHAELIAREVFEQVTQDVPEQAESDAMTHHLKKQIFADWLNEKRASTVIERYVAL